VDAISWPLLPSTVHPCCQPHPPGTAILFLPRYLYSRRVPFLLRLLGDPILCPMVRAVIMSVYSNVWEQRAGYSDILNTRSFFFLLLGRSSLQQGPLCSRSARVGLGTGWEGKIFTGKARCWERFIRMVIWRGCVAWCAWALGQSGPLGTRWRNTPGVMEME